MRHALTHAAIAALCTGAVAGCPDPVIFACADDSECEAGEICAGGVCSVAPPGCPAGTPPFFVTLTSDGAPLCAASVSAVDGAGHEHDLFATTLGGACLFASNDDLAPAVVHARAFGRQEASADVEVGRKIEGGSCFAGATLDLAKNAGVCRDDADCGGGGVCVVDDAADTATCRTPAVDARADGAGCASDAQCVHGLCAGGVCSALCGENEACAASQVCAPSPGLLETSACAVRDDLPAESCGDDADCADTARVCADLVDGGLACRLPPPGDAAVGDACNAEGASDACADGLCDDAVDGRCTKACAGDADCPAAGPAHAQSRCTSIAIDGVDARACFEPCGRVADCAGAPERTCRARVDVVADEIVFACDGARGAGQLGDAVQSATECAGNFALSGASGQVCSAPCVTDADCGGAGCATVTLQRPSGGTQQVQACLP